VYDSTDYELDWPAELLRSELLALHDHPHRAWTASEIELLREAFHTEVPVNDFIRVSSLDGWSGTATGGRDFINDLLANLDQMREYAPSLPYWPVRRTGPASAVLPRGSLTGQEKFAYLVSLFY
jgi:hypothetical protein